LPFIQFSFSLVHKYLFAGDEIPVGLPVCPFEGLVRIFAEPPDRCDVGAVPRPFDAVAAWE